MSIIVTVVENLENINVDVVDASVVVDVSIDQFASEKAVESAKEAKESADNAKVSEDNALISAESALLSEQEANQAKEDAELAKVDAENARDTAIEAKDDAIEAKDDAIQAKEDAELAQLGAETARDAILDKAEINLTTAGNILRADGTTYKAVNETKQNFLSNPPSSYYNIIDSFERPNSTVIGNTDNGLNWQGNLTEYEILNGFLRGLNSNFSVTPLPIYIESIINSNIFGKTIEFIYYPRGQTRSLQNLNIIIGYIDSSNYFNIRLSSGRIVILQKLVNNILTTVSQIVLGSVDSIFFGKYSLQVQNNLCRLNGDSLFLREISLTDSEIQTMITNGALNKTGFSLSNFGAIKNFRQKNIDL